MTEQVKPPGRLTTAQKARRHHRKQRRIATWLFCNVMSALLAVSSARAVELEVTRKGEGTHVGFDIEIINVDTKPIKIANITVNNRPECILRTYAQIGSLAIAGKDPGSVEPPFQGSTLKVGDSVYYTGACRMVRATIETDAGSETYTFRGSASSD